jgi:hypothetical protein
MPRDSIYSLGCTCVVHEAGGGNSISGGVAHLEHICMLQGGFCLEKKATACTCKSVMKDDEWKTDLWAAPCCVGAGVAMFG